MGSEMCIRDRFETVEVENCVLLMEGYGACISIIGIDIR